MATGEPKRRGRPPIAEQDRKTSNLTFRTRGDLRAKLEEAAQESGRSISEEIEHRLHSTFDKRLILNQIWGGASVRLMEAVNIINNKSGWHAEDGAAANLAIITTVLAQMETTYDDLIGRVEDYSVWMVLSQLGIARACNLKIADAKSRALEAIPEMAEKIAERPVSKDAWSIED